MLRSLAAALLLSCAALSAANAQTIYPIDRADILVGSKFDFKVEFEGLAEQSALKLTINGDDAAKVFGKAPEFVAREDGKTSRRCCCAMSRWPSPAAMR